MKRTLKTRTAIGGAALVLAGFGAGAVLAATGAASAVTSSSSPSSSSSSSTADDADGDGGGGGHAGETALTGTTADKVKAAALAKYPGATIVRLETDSDGVYEAHITTTDGQELIVQTDKSFTVTGTQTGGGHGDNDGDGPDASTAG